MLAKIFLVDIFLQVAFGQTLRSMPAYTPPAMEEQDSGIFLPLLVSRGKGEVPSEPGSIG
jgi:hypothetical protein